MIGHQVRPGGAVHAHGQQVVIGDGGVERVDGLAGQHGAGAFDGDRGYHGNVEPEVAAQLVDSHEAGFQAAGIEAGLDEQIIGAAFDEGFGLDVVIGTQAFKGNGALDIDVFIGGPDGAGDEARLSGGGVLVGGLARDLCSGKVELVGAAGEMVIG